MDRNDLVKQLADRMGTGEEEAAAWLAAVLEALNGAYAGDNATEAATENVTAKKHSVAPQSETPQRQAEIARRREEMNQRRAEAAQRRAEMAQRLEAMNQRNVAPPPGAPILRSITPAARLSVGEEIPVDRFPFRVGREGQPKLPTGTRGRLERRSLAERSINELYVPDFGKFVNVSREHFQIETKDDGSYELVDRGSACGTIVGDQVVGGKFEGGRCPLNFGDSIVVGTDQSNIVFEFCQAAG